eukprot:m.76619 g.76619  ORF g.76619 m.76619 type:complete len:161 (+) comp12493_c0_seq1:3712-4194(+)
MMSILSEALIKDGIHTKLQHHTDGRGMNALHCQNIKTRMPLCGSCIADTRMTSTCAHHSLCASQHQSALFALPKILNYHGPHTIPNTMRASLHCQNSASFFTRCRACSSRHAYQIPFGSQPPFHPHSIGDITQSTKQIHGQRALCHARNGYTTTTHATEK